MLIENVHDRPGKLAAMVPPPILVPLAGMPMVSSIVGFSLGILFLTFLKIGALVYGSGYVLSAFLRDDFVTRLSWLTDRQLIDAVAVGQFTPGPVFTTATFIGYLVGGLPGALLATVGIFLPSFVFVAAANPVVSRLRASPWPPVLFRWRERCCTGTDGGGHMAIRAGGVD